jgi:hypothetical protein
MAVAIYVYVSLMSFFLFNFSVQTIFVVQFVNCFLLNEKAESLPILLKKEKKRKEKKNYQDVLLRQMDLVIGLLEIKVRLYTLISSRVFFQSLRDTALKI